MAATDNRAVMIDRVISRAATTIRGNPLTVLGISFLFGALPSAVTRYATGNLRGNRISDGSVLAGIGAMIALWGVVVVCSYILTQAALTRATLVGEEGRRAAFGDCLLVALRALLPLIGLNILLGIAILFGFVLLLVPGVMLAIIWAVANPAIVAERCGVFAAFSRSSTLTRGARWKVFGVELLAIVFTWLLSSVSTIVLVAVKGSAGFLASGRGDVPLWFMLFSAAVQALTIAIWATIQASLYVELRDWKEGPQAASLAEVFA